MDDGVELLGDIEVMKKMEDEHLRLQRQFRVIQTDRQHRTMGVHPQFRSQDHLLRCLKKEYNNLNKDLKIARSGRHKKNDKRMKSELEKALLLRMSSEAKRDAGYSIMDELDELLQLKAKEMMLLKQVAIANEGELEARRFQSENRLMSAENKLEAAMLRFNNIQCQNKKIREEIEHMLKDRALFNQSWEKMLAALGTGKKFLSDLFESSTLASDQRDEWCQKLRSIQEKGKMDQALQIQEMRDLKKAFDHEMKIYNFLAKKGVKRVNIKQEQREAEEKRVEEEEKQRQYSEHIKILNDINEYTNENDFSKIKKNFKKVESENFSIYKLLTDYCAENEVLTRDLNNIRRDIADRRDFNEMREAKQDDRIIKLRDQLSRQKKITEAVRQKSEEQNQLLNWFEEKIQEMFQMLDCNLEPFQHFLGDKQPSLQTRKMSLLLITEKIKEHIQNVYYCEHVLKRKEAGPTACTSRLKKTTIRADAPVIFTPTPLPLLVPSDPCPSCIESRWLSRVSESLERPFDKDQTLAALLSLARDPAYMRSDRLHALTDCRATASRRLLATRHVQF